MVAAAMPQYKPPAGQHISDACRSLIAFSQAQGDDAWMVFNDIRIEARPDDTAAVLAQRWQSLSDERRRVYEQSEEYRQSQLRRQEIAQGRQKTVSALMEFKRFETLESTLNWLDTFTDNADDVDVKFDGMELRDALLAAGYEAGEGVTDDPGERERITSDKTAMGRYIVGQVLSCLEGGMPPHPMTSVFVDRWRAMP